MRIFCPFLLSSLLLLAGISGCGASGEPPEETLPKEGATNAAGDSADSHAPPGQTEPGSEGEPADESAN